MNSEMAYLGTLPSDRGGDTCGLFGVVNFRFMGLYQVGCVPDESTINLGSQVSLRTVLKELRKQKRKGGKKEGPRILLQLHYLN